MVNKMPRLWTEQEDEYLMGRYTIQPIETTAKKLNRSIVAVKKRAGLLGISKYHDNTYAGTIAKCFHVSMSVIHRWASQYGMPYYREKAGKGYRYRIDVVKFWKWAEVNKDLIDWKRYETKSLPPEPKWVKVILLNYQSTNKRKRITKTEKDKIKLLIAKGVFYKDIALMLGRTTDSIKHIASRM